MDVTIHEALETADRMIVALRDGAALPVFSVDPLGR
jgi:hypothetical protein